MFINWNNNTDGDCQSVTPFQVGFGNGGSSTPHCYTPCPHSISLVEGYNTGYAYWDATLGTWTFGAVASGITSLNTLTASAQTLVVGTSGADFNISSLVSTHTFNLPTASAVNRGALSSADWISFNAKESVLTFSQPLVRTANTIKLGTLSSFGAANQLLSSNTSATDIEYRTLQFGTGSTGNDLNMSFAAGSITMNIPTATSTIRGVISAADWTTFNAKIGGSGTNGYAAFFTAASTISSDSAFQWDNTNKRLGIGTAPTYNTDILWTPPNATLTGRALNVSINNTSLSGAATNYAAYFNNTAGSGGADVRYGIYSQTNSTGGLSGTGTLYGLFGYVQGQNTGYGVYGQAHGNSNSSRSHYGVYGTTGNYNASGTTAAGGYFRATTSGSTTATVVAGLISNLAYAPDTTSTSKDWVYIGQANSVNVFMISGAGRVSIGNFWATAGLHIRAGSATANTAPLQIDSGTLETTARAGVMEYNGSWYQTKASALRYGIGGVVYEYYTDASNTLAAETDLYSSTTPASTLAGNGGKLNIEYSGITAANANNKTIKLYFGGTAIFDSGALALNNINWHIHAYIIRVSATVVRYSITYTLSSGATYQSVGELTGLTLSNTNVLKITGTGTATTDITAKSGYVEWKPSSNL